MPRMDRLLNPVVPLTTWTKVFDEDDYKKNRVHEIKVKLRETSTNGHFRYNYDGGTSVYGTSTSGFIQLRNVQQLWVYLPDAEEAIEIELVYK